MNRMILILLAVFLLAGCSSKKYLLLETKHHTKANRVSKTYSPEYYILPQDRLKISIYKNPEETDLMDSYASLSTAVDRDGILVDSRGFIRLPLIGKLKVSGLTQDAAADKIARKYSGRLRNPTVYLEVMNKRIYILGEVNKPGVVKIDKEKLTILEAIAFGGDFTDSAIRDSVIVITRDRQGRMSMREIDMTNFDTLKRTNLIIKPNDIIYVKPDSWKELRVTLKDLTPVLSAFNLIAQPINAVRSLDK